MSVLFNERAGREGNAPPPFTAPLAFHQRLPSYAPTPLHDLPELATELGIGALLVKDESDRLGLPAFKVLGSSWAIYRQAAEMLGSLPAPWSSLEQLAERLQPLRPLRLVAATDGNHGRSVARVASWLEFDAAIFVPQGTAAARIAAIESEGAEVTVVEGSYDLAVERAADQQNDRSILVQDSAWPGYELIPTWVIDGYSTLFHEVDQQLNVRGERGPDLVLVQIGVGSLAAAAIIHFRHAAIESPPRMVGVEPVDAACAMESLAKGSPVVVPGPHRSMMAGLNCGTLSSVAWPLLLRCLDAAVAAPEERAAEAVRSLAACGIRSGESGAAGLAGLSEVLRGPQAEEARERLGIDHSTRVLILSTEGITDEENYRRIVDAG
jgi:diaminopropionate ammonia-lyase